MKLCDPFREAGIWFRVADRDFLLTCPCGVQQRGHELERSVSGQVTLYSCPHCGRAIAGVTEDHTKTPPGSLRPDDTDGHRMCGYAFGSTVDLSLFPTHAAEEFLHIPARPAFFSERGVPTAGGDGPSPPPAGPGSPGAPAPAGPGSPGAPGPVGPGGFPQAS